MSVFVSNTATHLAQQHWNETALFVSEEKRYGIYPWLPKAAEFKEHRGEHVLEIGCGTGCDLLQFAKNGAFATGVDITDKHLELAKQRLNGLTTILKADGAVLPFPAECFDYAYSHGVIHHSDHPRTIVREIFRVLKPEGRFNIQLYAAHSLNLLLKKAKYPLDWRLHIENSTSPVHLDFYSRQAVFDLVAPAREVRVRKFHCTIPLIPSRITHKLAAWLGYYVVVTGKKPAQLTIFKTGDVAIAKQG